MLTTKQIATMLESSERQVERYIAKGWLRADRVGRDYLIKPEAVAALKGRLLRQSLRDCSRRERLYGSPTPGAREKRLPRMHA